MSIEWDDGDRLLEQVGGLIGQLNEFVEKSVRGEISKAFAQDQIHALVCDIREGLDKITESLKQNEVSRAAAILIARTASDAIKLIEQAEFRD